MTNMDISISFIRSAFALLAMILAINFTSVLFKDNSLVLNLLMGSAGGLFIAIILISSEKYMKKFNLRTFNTLIIGLFLGYLLAKAVSLVLENMTSFAPFSLAGDIKNLIQAVIYLFCVFVAVIMTARAAEEAYVCLPFVKFSPHSLQKKDLLLDNAILQDARLIDVAASGLLDHHLVLPRYILAELYAQLEKGDESAKARSKRALEVVKKLESIPTLGLRYCSTDFPEIKDPLEKLIKLARFLDANLLTSDISQIQQSNVEDIRVIKFQNLCNALKPLSQSGEFINIKIQRYGKEPRQGVGYLDDGTMVVVNGGAEFIGEVIKAQVLSVKHTSSGRMIFSNASQENLYGEEELSLDEESLETHPHPKNYFAV